MEEALSKKEDHIKQAQDEHEATIRKVINFVAFCFEGAWLPHRSLDVALIR